VACKGVKFIVIFWIFGFEIWILGLGLSMSARLHNYMEMEGHWAYHWAI
jgi:hypothetical protein